MSDPRGTAAPAPGRSSRSCEWCIYGLAKWWVEWSPRESLDELEAEICDRCMNELHERELLGLVYVWAVEET